MNGAFHIAGIGLTSQQNALDTIANNIANMNTRAFKRADVRFSEIMSASTAAAGLEANMSASNTDLAGAAMRAEFMLNSQGVIERTDQPLDFAIDGEGFVELMSRDGNSVLWRGGSLQVGADGFLTAENGMALAAQVNVPEEATDISIDAEGRVSVMNGEGEIEDIGQISLVKLLDSNTVQRLDGGFYQVLDGADVRDTMPGEDGTGRILQGSIERSNVELNREMVQMMIVQRAYSANAQVVQAADQMLSIANTLRR